MLVILHNKISKEKMLRIPAVVATDIQFKLPKKSIVLEGRDRITLELAIRHRDL